MATQLVKNIQRILIPKTASLDFGDLATYLGVYGAGSTYGPTADWLSISVTSNYETATYSGSNFGNRPITALTAGINATDLTIRVTAGTLATYPVPGYIYIGTEAIYYDSIDPSTTSASGDDEFILSTVAYRGALNTTAATHSTLDVVKDIIVFYTESINRDVDSGVFNVSYKATQYGRTGYQAPNVRVSFADSERAWPAGAVVYYEILDSTG